MLGVGCSVFGVRTMMNLPLPARTPNTQHRTSNTPPKEKTMQIILKEDVKDLGRSGEMVTVAEGYARNYLLPRKLAVSASPGNMKDLPEADRRRQGAGGARAVGCGGREGAHSRDASHADGPRRRRQHAAARLDYGGEYRGRSHPGAQHCRSINGASSSRTPSARWAPIKWASSC